MNLSHGNGRLPASSRCCLAARICRIARCEHRSAQGCCLHPGPAFVPMLSGWCEHGVPDCASPMSASLQCGALGWPLATRAPFSRHLPCTMRAGGSRLSGERIGLLGATPCMSSTGEMAEAGSCTRSTRGTVLRGHPSALRNGGRGFALSASAHYVTGVL